MADKAEYYYPPGDKPGNAPYDPAIGSPPMQGRRWAISWDKSGKELPKLKDGSDMKGTRVLDAGKARPGFELHVMRYKDFFK